jgi:hypothetical protein
MRGGYTTGEIDFYGGSRKYHALAAANAKKYGAYPRSP